MAAVACPFKPVSQRERPPDAPHVHRFDCEVLLDEPGIWVQDCACGHRRRVRKGPHGEIVEEFHDALVEGGSSCDNGVLIRQEDGSWRDRWAIHALTKGEHHVDSLSQ